jgi:hypothetical protein
VILSQNVAGMHQRDWLTLCLCSTSPSDVPKRYSAVTTEDKVDVLFCRHKLRVDTKLRPI